MRVWRVVRLLVMVVVVAALVGAAVSAFATRPDIEDAKGEVDRSWSTLSPSLAKRYALLAGADGQLRDVAGPIRDVVTDVDAALTRWTNAYQHSSVDVQVSAANAVEASARRLLATVANSPRLANDQPAKDALAGFAFDGALSRAAAFNQAVARYQRERQGPLRQVVASVWGAGDIPGLDTTAPAPS